VFPDIGTNQGKFLTQEEFETLSLLQIPTVVRNMLMTVTAKTMSTATTMLNWMNGSSRVRDAILTPLRALHSRRKNI
jgi:hypothetical protein